MDTFEMLTEIYKQGIRLSDIQYDDAGVRVLQACNANMFKVIPKMLLPFDKEVYYLQKFINSGYNLMYPIGMFSWCTGFGFRSLGRKKEFSVFNDRGMPSIYTSTRAIQERNLFKFGTPIVITEGAKDAEVVSLLYPYSFSCLTNGVNQRTSEFLSMFTDKAIVIPDEDSGGQRGGEKSRKNLEKFGFKVYRISVKMDDPGNLLDKTLEGSQEAIRELRLLKSQIELFTSQTG